ncbi:hypothetical protein EYF80_042339 [Liparis tanakae]|uniref:Uncharacterized protein n=1 Tax=Liparis tanakae TaxID=230148 RepID=A0A4Z2G3S2_9TELE|nr:hypothetical protein EYF80_042339 [Liparis tanakae]
MAWTIGTIMAVVAVLLIHMDRKAVTPMNPSINLGDEDRGHTSRILIHTGTKRTLKEEVRTHMAGRTPTSSRTRSAMRLWRFQCSTAMATISPPTNSMLVSFRNHQTRTGTRPLRLKVHEQLLQAPAQIPETRAAETRSPETRSPESRSPETKSPEIRSSESRAPWDQRPDLGSVQYI